MTVYKLTYSTTDAGHCISYHSSKAKARAAIARARRAAALSGDPAPEYADITALAIIPTKAGILHFLNFWTPRADNS